jgi:hypothetical protein
MNWTKKIGVRQKTQNGGQATYSLYFKLLKIVFQSFKKIYENILDLANDIYYKRVKSLYELLCIAVYTKNGQSVD